MNSYKLHSYDTFEWKRDFPGERINAARRILHMMRGGIIKPSIDITAVLNVVDALQCQFIDTNFYYRVGGVDHLKAKANNGILAIQWGIGSRKADTFDDQISIAKDQEIPYITWIIFDPDDSMTIGYQVNNYLDDPDVMAAPAFVDKEKPRSTTRMINYNETEAIVLTIKDRSPFKAGMYSRENLFRETFGTSFPQFMEDVWQWIAQYPLFYIDGSWIQARYYEQFLSKWEWSLPPSVTSSPLYSDQKWRDLVLGWQFSSYGDAEYYIAPEWIEPGQPGIKSCDLNVSMDPKTIFLQKLFATEEPPDTGECNCIEEISALEASLLEKITKNAGDIISLRSYVVGEVERLDTRIDEHTHDEEPPDPPEETEFITVQVNEGINCPVYALKDYDQSCSGDKEPPDYDGAPGKPIPDTKIGRFAEKTLLRVHKFAYVSCHDNPYDPFVITAYGDDLVCYMLFDGQFAGSLIPEKRVHFA